MLNGTILSSATLLVMMTIVDAQFYEGDYYADNNGGDVSNVGPGEVCLVDQECQFLDVCPEGEIGRCIKHPPTAVYGKCQCFFDPGRCNNTKDCPKCEEGLHAVCYHNVCEHNVCERETFTIGVCKCDLNPGRCWDDRDCHNRCPEEEVPYCKHTSLLPKPGKCSCKTITCKTDKDCPDNCHYNEKPKCKHELTHNICTCVADPHYCAKDTDCPHCKPSDPLGPFCIKPSGCPYGKCECFPWLKQ